MNRRRPIRIPWRGIALGIGCGLAAWLFAITPFGRGVEDWFQDANFAFRGTRSSSTKVIIVAIDDDSLEQIPKPLADTSPELAEVISFLHDQGAKSIGLDVFIPESLDVYDQEHGGGGSKLGVATFRAGNVVLPTGLGDNDRQVRPLTTWRAGGALLGLVDAEEDLDRFVRRYQLAALVKGPKGPESLDSLALGMLEAAGDVTQSGALRINDRPLPRLDRDGCVRINFVGRPGTIPRVPFHQILARIRDQSVILMDHKGHSVDFADAYVIIGATARSLGDWHATPYANGSWWLPGMPRSELMAGPEVQADALATLAEGRFIITPWWLQALPWTLITGAILGAVFARINLTRGAIVAVLHHFGWKGFSLIGFSLGAYRIDVLPLLGTGVLCYFATFALRWRILRRMFGAVKSEAIARALEDDPGHMRLKGEERWMTVLFSDIRNFTHYSEGHTPQEVVALLNAYFAEMVPILEKHGATVDKYIGDGIMALFGAPDDQHNHASQAALAAVKMVARVHQLSGQWSRLGFPDLKIGVGVHTGHAVVGTIGSPRRLDYTAVGDTVNAAARIESENKTLGTEVLLSSTTYAALTEAERLKLGVNEQTATVMVKGKDRSLNLHPVFVDESKVSELSIIPGAGQTTKIG